MIQFQSLSFLFFVLLSCTTNQTEEKNEEFIIETRAENHSEEEYIPSGSLIPFLQTKDESDSYGYCDSLRNIVIPCQFDYAEPFIDGIAKVRNDGYEWLIDESGQCITAQKYYSASNENGLLLACYADEMVGMFNSSGQLIIDHDYVEITPLLYRGIHQKDTQGNYLVKVIKPDFTEGIFTKEGEPILPAEYARIQHEGSLLSLLTPRPYAYRGIADINGNITIPTIYYQLRRQANELKHLFIASKEDYDQFGIIDLKNNVIAPFEYLDIDDFSNGLARAEKGENHNDYLVGYLNTDGEIQISFEYDTGTEFNADGVAVVRKDNVHYLIDRNNNRIETLCDSCRSLGGLYNDLIAVNNNHFYGYIDRNGNVRITGDYDKVSDFIGEFAVVSKEFLPSSGTGLPATMEYKIIDKNDVIHSSSFGTDISSKINFIDLLEKGEYYRLSKPELSSFSEKEVDSIYQCILNDFNGIRTFYHYPDQVVQLYLEKFHAPAKAPSPYFSSVEFLNSDYPPCMGMVNRSGQWIIPPIYDEIDDEGFRNAYFPNWVYVRKDQKWGFIDSTGSVRIPFKYDRIITAFENGLAKVQKEGMEFYIDTEGNEYHD